MRALYKRAIGELSLPITVMDHLHTLDIVLGLSALYILYALSVRRKARTILPLPPGPKRLPLIGNLLDTPKGFPAAFWALHESLYGALCSLIHPHETDSDRTHQQRSRQLCRNLWKDNYYSQRRAGRF